jgi:ABC-type glutathione transport system ATPase component
MNLTVAVAHERHDHARRTMTREPNGLAVRAERLRREFNGTTAVESLDLEITKGEIYGFLGPNGAGKSTTVRMLCTLLAPTGGHATVAGHDVATDPGAVRLRIGAALQDVALDPKQTGTELLRLQGRLYGLSTRASRPTQAGCAGASTSRRRSCTTPRSCSSTSPPPGSIPSAALACGRRCAGSTRSSA